MTEKTVTIFGTGRAVENEPVYESAYVLGKLLVRSGFVIANGGYGGTMFAAAKGAAQTGGKAIGVTCSVFGRDPNEYITQQVNTDSLDERLDKLIDLGDAYVVLAGGTGTLLELAKIWELKNKGFLETQKAIIIVGEFWQPLIKLIETDNPDAGQSICITAGPDEAVGELINNI